MTSVYYNGTEAQWNKNVTVISTGNVTFTDATYYFLDEESVEITVSTPRTLKYADDNKATGFLATIKNATSDNFTFSGTKWEIYSPVNEATKTFSLTNDEVTLEPDASVIIGFVIDTLYDSTATAAVEVVE